MTGRGKIDIVKRMTDIIKRIEESFGDRLKSHVKVEISEKDAISICENNKIGELTSTETWTRTLEDWEEKGSRINEIDLHVEILGRVKVEKKESITPELTRLVARMERDPDVGRIRQKSIRFNLPYTSNWIVCRIVALYLVILVRSRVTSTP